MTRFFLFLVAFVVLAKPALAQPLADKIPDDAIIYAAWAGSDALADPYKQSRLKGVVDNSNIPKLFTEFLPALADRIGQEDPQAGDAIRAALSVTGPLWKRPGAIYFGGIDMAAEQPMPRVGIVVDGGNEAKNLADTVNAAIQKTGNALPVQASVHGNRYVVLVAMIPPPPQMMALLEGQAGGKTLAASPRFTEALKHVRKGAAVTVYVDGEGLVKLANEAMAKGAPPDARQTWEKARDTLVLNGVRRLIYTAGFDGADWVSDAFIDAPAPRKGLAAMLDAEPLTDNVLKAMPKSTTWAMAGRFDLSNLLAAVRFATEQFDPDSKQDLEAALAEAKKQTGVDIEKDIIEPLGSEWGIYLSPNVGGGNMMGFAIVNKLDDAQKLKGSLDKLAVQGTKALHEAMKREKMTLAFRTTKAGDIEVNYFAMPFIAPAWTVRDGNLYIGLYPQTVSAAAGHVASKGPSILENEAYIAMRKRLGGQTATAIHFADLPKTAPSSYPTLLMMLRMGTGMADMFGAPVPEMILPPLDKLMASLTPAGSVAWSDAAGLHYRTVNPFPGASMLETEYNIMAGQGAVMVSILLPALNAAKERANRVKCASNLRQIGMGCILYANDNKGKYPATPGDLLEADLNPLVFICPTSGTAPPDQQILADPKRAKEWINANSDYIYLGGSLPGKVLSSSPADMILAHEKLENHDEEGINILFNDGHVEWVIRPQAEEMLRKQMEGGNKADANKRALPRAKGGGL